MSDEEIIQLKVLLDKAIINLDLGVRDINTFKGVKFILSKVHNQ